MLTKRWDAGAAVHLGLGIALLLLHGQPAAAREQYDDKPPAKLQLVQVAQDASRITVPPVLQAEPSSSVALRIAIPSPRDLPPNSYLRMRGLPPALALTEGYAISPGSWAVPLASLSNLRIIVPVGVSGTSDVVVTLVSVDGAALAEAKMTLTISAPSRSLPPSAVAETPAPSPPPRRTQPVQLTPAAKEKAEKLVQRGEQELGNGNIAQARGFFMRAADSGFARGALMLASTFDPAELARLKVQGVQPNPDEARKWYERARELGAPEASERLTALSNR